MMTSNDGNVDDHHDDDNDVNNCKRFAPASASPLLAGSEACAVL